MGCDVLYNAYQYLHDIHIKMRSIHHCIIKYLHYIIQYIIDSIHYTYIFIFYNIHYFVYCIVLYALYSAYSRAHKLFGHLNARRCDFNINIIIPTRKPPLSVSN